MCSTPGTLLETGHDILFFWVTDGHARPQAHWQAALQRGVGDCRYPTVPPSPGQLWVGSVGGWWGCKPACALLSNSALLPRRGALLIHEKGLAGPLRGPRFREGRPDVGVRGEALGSRWGDVLTGLPCPDLMSLPPCHCAGHTAGR